MQHFAWPLMAAAALQPERLPGQHSYFPLDILWPQNRWQMFSQILPFTPVDLDQILLDVLTLAAVPPYPWGQLIYHEVLQQRLKSGLKGHFAEFGVGLGGSSLFFGHMAAQWGRRMLAVDSFQGLPDSDPAHDEPYFAEGDFGSEGSNAQRFQQLLENFGLNSTIDLISTSFAETVVPREFQELAFVHIDGDLYHSVLDALEKTWDLVQPGGIVVIDDFFHKVQGPARATADFFRSRALAPLFHVVPAYAVLVVKGDANCAAPRALDGNFYSFELARDFEPFVQAVERSLLRSPEGRARDNAAAFWDFLRYPSDAVASGADIFRYLAPLEDMLDLTDGIGPCAAPRKGRVVSIPTEKRVEHVFTNCQPLERDSCTEQEREFIDAADLQRESQVELELLRMSQLLDMSQSTTEPRNAELLDRMVILKRLKRENSWRFGRTSSKQRSATPRRQLRHAKRGCSAATLGGRWTDPLVVSGCVDLEHGKGGSDLFPRPTYRLDSQRLDTKRFENGGNSQS
ncbi:unnamed protein product [Cladocopium goreaui]|uniref:Macrocin O-methyltransferase (MacOMeTase) (Tylosin biosynthesis protein F) n=1 Tax=Cladocopium goreaui TaxID=2562237 RepID=A0A9P1FKK3_9DINO|nr:unnamed protein product [Cladocopium goreaui]